MITVVGEALIDLVVSPDGAVTAALGGAPFNTARACARLGVDVAFVGALSTDRFGLQLAHALSSDGVDVSQAPRVDRPTTLAVAELDDGGAATYRFYVHDTSAPHLDARPDLRSADVVFTGGLALVLEPMASNVEAIVTDADGATLMVDVNCRPALIADRDAYRARLERIAACAALVKASDEDLGYLYPGAATDESAARLLQLGVEAVLVTAGAKRVEVVMRDRTVRVPVEPVEVVDTVGAGDTFDGALLAWLVANDAFAGDGLGPGVIERAVTAANVAAGVACTRRGADPPRRDELGAHWWD